MTNKLEQILSAKTHQEHATATGRAVHAKMSHVFYAQNGWVGDKDIIKKLSDVSDMCELFGPLSRTEVPIAGYINGKFISRRIDRLYINHDTKSIVVLDYKTDLDKKLFYKKYIEQLTEYCALLTQIYHGYHIECKILWLNDFTLENII